MSLGLLSLVTGLAGTLTGAGAGLLLPSLPALFMGCLLNLTGGLMLSIVCFELLPEAIVISQPWAIGGVLAGSALMLLFHRFSDARSAGLMLCLGVALHNLPEGLAVGAGFRDASLLGLTLALCIVLHDLPEGLAMAVSLRKGDASRPKVLSLALLGGLPGVAGVWAGYWIGGAAPQALSFCLALAAGAMLQIICQHLLPQARRESASPLVTFCLSLGVLGGALMTHWL